MVKKTLISLLAASSVGIVTKVVKWKSKRVTKGFLHKTSKSGKQAQKRLKHLFKPKKSFLKTVKIG
ncbi:hypothetical protein QA601_09680 [Chitinispirillales bacterium ANBcel5]|uniref:hypothetical protein n=1 Tax=Cellulosispirillum alkaliphilum TaxID=3039283 RepID=UPI002A5021AE|nr:hypothetical protein [Chitinispirillales bacterium ANBcel5]